MPTRRGNGEGSISKRPNGGYQVKRRYTDAVTGESKRISLYGKTSDEVRAKLRDFNDRLDEGSPGKDSSTKVGVWCTRWATTSLLVSNRAETTKEQYARAIRSHVTRANIADIRLDRLKPTDIERWIVELKKRYADSTVRMAYLVLRAALDGAVRDGLIARNPAAKMSAPRPSTSERPVMTPQEARQVLEGARTSRYYGAVLLIAHTGARRGEACAATWNSIDWEKKEWFISQTLVRVDGKDKLSAPKTKKSKRRVPLTDEVIEELKRLRLRQKQERLRAGNQWRGHHEMVFTNLLGDFVSAQNMLTVVRQAAMNAGIPGAEKVGPHTFRHSFATTLLERGVHLKAVADLLGHSSMSTLLTTYAHLTPHQARGAVDTIADAMRV